MEHVSADEATKLRGDDVGGAYGALNAQTLRNDILDGDVLLKVSASKIRIV